MITLRMAICVFREGSAKRFRQLAAALFMRNRIAFPNAGIAGALLFVVPHALPPRSMEHAVL
jgi:hypothetical protein